MAARSRIASTPTYSLTTSTRGRDATGFKGKNRSKSRTDQHSHMVVNDSEHWAAAWRIEGVRAQPVHLGRAAGVEDIAVEAEECPSTTRQRTRRDNECVGQVCWSIRGGIVKGLLGAGEDDGPVVVHDQASEEGVSSMVSVPWVTTRPRRRLGALYRCGPPAASSHGDPTQSFRGPRRHRPTCRCAVAGCAGSVLARRRRRWPNGRRSHRGWRWRRRWPGSRHDAGPRRSHPHHPRLKNGPPLLRPQCC
jgi:hypothetical protein